jgi:lipopolysaccharide transport system ATP-binding protein
MSQSDIAISVRNLSKAYTISHQTNGLRGRRPTFRDTVTHFVSDPFRKTPKETFWALKDVSFDVKKGDVVGIIGRNGAGKSTLLKILSRITKPTSGEIDVYGRIGSLLEVGTGFSNELSGRENIFLNGAILGMTRSEIRRQFNAIVDFSGVEKFLDTPVKRYSSGMFVRLAFAVAAHLEPEILLVDEILAVGDAEFQKKCIAKMKEVSNNGRTVIIVSHNSGTLRVLCNNAVVLDRGQLMLAATVERCIDFYQSTKAVSFEIPTIEPTAPPDANITILRASLLVNGSAKPFARTGDDLSIHIECLNSGPRRNVKFGYVLRSSAGVGLINANNRFLRGPLTAEPDKVLEFVVKLGSVPLQAGIYNLDLYLGEEQRDHHIVKECLSFEVEDQDIWGEGGVPPRNASDLWWPSEFEVIY